MADTLPSWSTSKIRTCVYFPCPTCSELGATWARVYPTDAEGEHYYCPTCRNRYTLEEVE